MKLQCKFLYDYVKPKYNKKAKLCCMDRDTETEIHQNRIKS